MANWRIVEATERIMRMYKKGDVVKVWSLQSFHGGGFLDGVEGIVSQDQIGKSVLVSVPRNFNGEIRIDPSYEVYAQQLELVREAPKPKNLLERWNELLAELKNR